MKETNNNRLADIQETAAYLSMKESWVRRRIFTKAIPYLKIGRLIRFDLDQIDSWVNSQTQGDLK